MHESHQQAQLLLVAARVFPVAAAKIQFQTLRDRPHPRAVDPAAQATQVGDDLAAAQPAELG